MSTLPLGDLPLPAELAATGDEPDEELLERWFEHRATETGTLVDESERYVPEQIQRFKVDDDRKAEWAMRKLAAAEARRAEHLERRNEWVARIAVWFDQATAKINEETAWLEGILSEYALTVREETGGKTKSIKVPSGTISTKVTNPAVVIEDPDVVLCWAEQAEPEIVTTVKKVNVTDLRIVVSPVEVPVTVNLSCGCKDVPAKDLERAGLADGVTCPNHLFDALVGSWATTVLFPVTENGEIVPGCDVSRAEINVRIEAR